MSYTSGERRSKRDGVKSICLHGECYALENLVCSVCNGKKIHVQEVNEYIMHK